MEYHSDRLILDVDRVIDLCAESMKLAAGNRDEETVVSLTIVELLSEQTKKSLVLESISKAVTSVFQSGCGRETLCDFVVELARRDFPYFDSHVLPPFLAVIVANVVRKKDDLKNFTYLWLRSLSKICDAKASVFRFEQHLLR
jgi:hypothetical protein